MERCTKASLRASRGRVVETDQAAPILTRAWRNSGDVRPVGEGVSELRIHYGPGYRVCSVQRVSLLIILLCGGDKSAQARDIALALKLAKEI